VRSQDEVLARDEFGARYAIATTDVTAAIEHAVIGAAWGVNGYTTVEQADQLACGLGLQPGARVLDVGTGRGWPSVYYAMRYGCRVVGTDLPVEGLRIATRRAAVEGVDPSFVAVAAAGGDQPFRDGVFDAIVHTDVLC
jgi:2-polyprenyl-3-methyl-5-hydroxy-6-metoxy-1,4-benzoquinol methylase